MIRWLQPGLGIKRWIVLIACSALVLGFGMALFIDPLLSLFEGNALLWGGGVLLGLAGIVAGVTGVVLTVASRTQHGSRSLYRTLKRQSELESGPRIVAIGGGTGLSTLLRGFKRISANLTAIVAVTDDGGSSGRLREEYDVPAPGDLRNCLVALAPEEERLSEVVSYRFSEGEELEGHSLGNLLLTALSDINGGFAEGIRECSEVLNVQGRVLPSMLGTPELQAGLPDGRTVVGETTIADAEGVPETLSIGEGPVEANPEAIASVIDSDCVVVGPGSLYTSILTNFLEPELCRAITRSPAPKVYVSNLMTEAGETEGYSVADHLEKFREIPPEPIEFDYVIVNTRQAPERLLEDYREEGSEQVVFDYDRVKNFDCELLTGNFMSIGEHLRHDIQRLTDEIQGIINREAMKEP
jgi:uncharacterized cofD-like protein